MPPPDLARLFAELKEKDPVQFAETAAPALKMPLTPEEERALIRTLAADYEKQLPQAIATQVIRLNNQPISPEERKSFLDFAIKHGDKAIGISAIAAGAGWLAPWISVGAGSPLGIASILYPFFSDWYSGQSQQKEKAQEQLLVMAIHNYYTVPSFKEAVDRLPPNIFTNDLDITPEKLIQRLPDVTKDMLLQVASIEHPEQFTQREIVDNLLLPYFKTTAATIVNQKLQEKTTDEEKLRDLYALRQEVDAGIKLTTLFVDKIVGKPEWASKFSAAAQSTARIYESAALFKLNKMSSLVLTGNVVESLSTILTVFTGMPTEADLIQRGLNELKQMMGEMWKDLSGQMDTLAEGQRAILTSLMQLDYKIGTLGKQLQDVSAQISHFQKFYTEQKRAEVQQRLTETLKNNNDLAGNAALSQGDFIKHLNVFFMHGTSVANQPVFAGQEHFTEEQPTLSSPLEYEMATLFELAKKSGVSIPANLLNESGSNPIEWTRGVLTYLAALNSTAENLSPNHVERDLGALWEKGLRITEFLHAISNKDVIKKLTSHYRKAVLSLVEDIRKVVQAQQGKDAIEKALLSLPSSKNFILAATALYKLTQLNYLRQASSVDLLKGTPTLLGKELMGLFSIHAIAAFVEENRQAKDIGQVLLDRIDSSIGDILDTTAVLNPMETVAIVEETMKILGGYAAYRYPLLSLKKPEFVEVSTNVEQITDPSTIIRNILGEMKHHSPSSLNLSNAGPDYQSEIKPFIPVASSSAPAPAANATSARPKLSVKRLQRMEAIHKTVILFNGKEITVPRNRGAQDFLALFGDDAFAFSVNRKTPVPPGSPKPSNDHVATNASVMVYTANDYPNNAVLLEGHTLRVFQIDRLSNGNYMTWSFDNSVRIWQKDGKPLNTFPNHKLLTLLPNNRVAMHSITDNSISIVDYTSGKRLNHLVGHTAEVRGFSLCDDGKAISNSTDKTLRIWDLDLEYPSPKILAAEPRNYEWIDFQALPGGIIFYYPRIRKEKNLISDTFYIADIQGAIVRKIKFPITCYNLSMTSTGLIHADQDVTWKFDSGLNSSHLQMLLTELVVNSSVTEIKWPSYPVDSDLKNRIDKILDRNRQIQEKCKTNPQYNIWHFCAENNEMPTLTQLVAQKGNIHSCCSLGRNALHYAGLSGNLSAAQLLVGKGVSACKTDINRETVLELATRNHPTNQALIDFLKQAQAAEKKQRASLADAPGKSAQYCVIT